LCDKGRFGTGYVNRADRPRQPQFRNGAVTTVSVDQALDQVIANIQGKKVLGIGSPRASLNQTIALRELLVKTTIQQVCLKKSKTWLN
jgi:NADH-quinone oxidoreductase subunit G